MLTVLSCITVQHDISLVILAGFLCALGSCVTSRLYQYSRTQGKRRLTFWHVTTGAVAGVSVWSTHFVAMLGYRPEAPVEFHLGLTAFSMAIAIVGCTFALMFAALSRCKYAAQIGGAFFGLAIASMHYTGMIAYRVQGIVYWDMNYLIASVVIAVVVSAAALTIGRGRRRRNEVLMAVILTLGIVSLHFTGMAAFGVYPLLIDGTFANAAAFKNLALAVSGTAVVIVFGGFISYVLENRARLESIAELTEARNAAESASKAKSEFLSVLSHELRTPLSIIMGYSTMLSKMGELQMKAANTNGNNVKTLPSPTLEQVELYGKKITTSSQHLLTLINEILDYSSMELDETKLDKTSFSVRDLLEEVTEQFKVLTEEKGITVALACDEPIVAYADRARIMQILINLLGNAVKFSSASDVTVRACLVDSGYRLEVEDNGCGIHENDFDRIFLAFKQLESAERRTAGGTGLGLAICKKLSEAHGGNIKVKSTLGAGTTFTVTLPASALDAEAAEAEIGEDTASIKLAS